MILLLLAFVTNVQAEILNYIPSDTAVLGTSISIRAGFNGLPLYLTGFGVGTKKMGPMRFNVSVVQLFTEHPVEFVRAQNGAVFSTDHTGANAISVTFVRTVKAKQVVELLNKNIYVNFNLNERMWYHEGIASLLAAVNRVGVFYVGQRIEIVFDPLASLIIFSAANGDETAVHSMDQRFLNRVMSIWLGTCPDTDCENLKRQLLDTPKVTEHD